MEKRRKIEETKKIRKKEKEEKKEKSEEENFKEMEEEVHRLLEGSAIAKVKKNFNEALIKAKEAASKEKKIR